MRGLASILLVCSLLGLAPSDAGERPKPEHFISKTTELKGIVFTASMTKALFTDPSVEITVKVQNKSKEDLNYRTMGKYIDYDLKLVNSKGKAVRYTNYGEIAYGKARGMGSGLSGSLLAPGKHFEVKINLSMIFDLTMTDDYTLSIRRRVRMSDKTYELEVENLKFTIIHDLAW